MHYNDGFKTRMVKRMLGSERISANNLSREVGVSQSTLSKWVRMVKEKRGMKRGNNNSAQKNPVNRSAQEKLRLVMEASTLSEEELGEFLRRNGIHEAQLREWTEAATGALESPKKKRSRKSPEAKRLQELERELRRKDKALAEVIALLALQKKLNLLFGEGEDSDTLPRSER